jgi:hypothetical protein
MWGGRFLHNLLALVLLLIKLLESDQYCFCVNSRNSRQVKSGYARRRSSMASNLDGGTTGQSSHGFRKKVSDLRGGSRRRGGGNWCAVRARTPPAARACLDTPRHRSAPAAGQAALRACTVPATRARTVRPHAVGRQIPHAAGRPIPHASSRYHSSPSGGVLSGARETGQRCCRERGVGSEGV